MKDIPLQITRHSYQARSTTLSSQRLVNMFASFAPPEAKSSGQGQPMALYGTSGLKLNNTIGSGPIRGMHLFGSELYIVSGNNLFTLTSGGSVTDLGSMGTISKNVTMDDNNTNVVINLATGASYYADSSTLTQITDGDYQSASSVTVLDGYGVFSKLNSDQYFISDLRDITSYEADQFARAEEKGDNLVRAYSFRGELWLFGERTTEVHQNVGAGDFPFLPLRSAASTIGCAAKLSVSNNETSIYWLGDDGVFYRSVGYTPERISTYAIEKIVNEFGDASDIHSFIFREEGHEFYCIPEMKLCYDTTTGLWHERESFEEDRWRASTYARAFNKNLVGDFENGNIYELDLDTYTENGTTLQKIITLPPLYVSDKRFTNDYVMLDFDTGVGLTTGQGSDPQVMLQWSDDGGRTFGNEHWRDLGEKGEYRTRATWRNLGQARERTYRAVISDPIQTHLVGGEISITVGES